MKTIAGSKFIPGKVLLGPKMMGEGYYRIVSQRDRSGQIEKYDPPSRNWAAATDNVTFDEVWSAPPVSQLLMDIACASPADEAEYAGDAETNDAVACDSVALAPA